MNKNIILFTISILTGALNIIALVFIFKDQHNEIISDLANISSIAFVFYILWKGKNDEN